MSLESDLFWLCATVQLMVSLRFVTLLRQINESSVRATLTKLAKGQRQDSWLASAVIWGMILCKSVPYSAVLYDAGSVVLAWLILRSLKRIRAVGSAS